MRSENRRQSRRLRWVSGRESYRYDGLGRRILAWSALDSQNILSMYTEAGQLAFQGDWRTANAYHNYLYLCDRLVAIVDQPFAGGSNVRYQHTDAQGTIVAQTDASRNVLTRSLYDSYGNARDHGNDDQPGYTGHLQDSLTGLTYMQQRYYDPTTERFSSADPVQADPDTGANFNRYWYANDNPYRYTDPTGMCTGTHICKDDLAVSSGTFTTKPLAGDALRARIATAQSRANQAINYLQRHEKDVSGSYSSPRNAASAFGDTFAKESGKLGVEFGANIMSGIGSGKLSYSLEDFSVSTDFICCGPSAGLAAGVAIAGRPGDPSHWGMVHTH